MPVASTKMPLRSPYAKTKHRASKRVQYRHQRIVPVRDDNLHGL